MTAKSGIAAGVVVMMFLSPAAAAPLTSADQAYLDRIRPQAGISYAQMDARSQAKFHAAIHDPATARDAKARGRAVGMLLDQYRHGWLWSLGSH